MTVLNSKGEVADLLSVDQFIPGKSAYECVAYSASLIYYSGQSGHGPTGTTLQASNLAQFYYGLEEGSNAASNTNGMSLEAEYDMLKRMGLHYQALSPNVAAVKTALQEGLPVMLCGAETGMYDIGLGDHIPYAWVPTGNHCIVASGIAPDGNLLVHDCANIAPTGVRTGPRVYDIAKLQIVSATAVTPQWKEERVIDIHTPGVSDFFTEQDANHWLCKQTGRAIWFAILETYKKYGGSGLCGLTWLGLPKTGELPIESVDPIYQHLAGQGIVLQYFERGCLVYDPKHQVDNPPGSGSVYAAQVYGLPGQDPVIKKLQSQSVGIDATKIKNFQTALSLEAHKLTQEAQALEAAIIVPLS